MSIYRSINAAPRSAYIHVPFCRHRCGYCNFALVAGRDRLIEPYLDAIEAEVQKLPEVYQLDTLFFGGGTPSHLSAVQMKRLGLILSHRFRLSADAEVTAECNPADITIESLDALQELGVNRISLGVQSFNDDKLKILQRDHSSEIAKAGFRLAMDRFKNVSMDLIFAAPGETLQDWEIDLDAAIELEPTHISTYELTYEKGTNFWSRKLKGELSESEEDLRANMYQAAIERFRTAWLEQYEVSSFAIEGFRCRHNMVYWQGNPWFAFGPGAADFVGGARNTSHASTTTWIKRIQNGESPIASTEVISGREHAIERLIFGLRMVDGINVDAFESASGFKLDELVGAKLSELEKLRLITRGEKIRLTEQGRMVADWVGSELFE